jgi:hypothetical protein
MIPSQADHELVSAETLYAQIWMVQGQCDDSSIKIAREHIFCELNCVAVGRAYRATWNELFVHGAE